MHFFPPLFSKDLCPHQQYENARCEAHAKATVGNLTSTVTPRCPIRRLQKKRKQGHFLNPFLSLM